MRTAFVSGGLGFLGRNLVEQLLADQWQVTVMDRDANLPGSMPNDWQDAKVTLVQGDITNRHSCLKAMPEDLDCIFHIAASTSHWQRGDEVQDRINIDGTRNMVAVALAKKAKRFVHTSSIAAYGFQPGPVSEQSPSTAPTARINYFRSKHKAELEVRRGISKGLDAVILNPANIIGRYDTVSWARMFKQIADGSLKAAPPGYGSFCDAAEVARIHLQAYYNGVCGENYLLGGVDAGFAEVMAEMARLLGCGAPKPVPAWILKVLGRVSYWGSLVTGKEPALTPETAELTSAILVCDSSKAMNELGFRAVPLADMLADSYQWLRSEGLLD